jgi:hypothetical protein
MTAIICCALSLTIAGLTFGWARATCAAEIKGLPDPKAPCAGELPKQHPYTPYDFTTNSQRPTDGLTFLHCVHNNRGDAVDIRWLIPELKEPVPGNESRLSPRYSVQPPLDIKDGCLIYGNLLDKDAKAQFWARKEDQDAVDREKAIGNCMVAFKNPPPVAKKGKGDRASLRDVQAPFRLFLAADVSAPDTSLMAFEGVTGVRVRSATSYESYLQYRVRPAIGSKATLLQGFTISPRWIGEVENLVKFYTAADNRQSMPIVGSGDVSEIHFTVEGSNAWTFDELQYELRNRERVVASVYVPTFIPVR